MSAGGGERGTARAETPMPPVNAWAIEQRGRHHPSTHGPSTTCRVGHRATPRPTPPVNTRAINADSPQRQHDRTQLRHDERGGGVRGRPCRNADATCRRVGHQATRPTPPVRAAHAATPMPPVNAWAIEQRGQHHPSGPPTPQRRCHLSTRGPSSNTADATRWGRPRRNADATCRRVGHRAKRPTPPVDARSHQRGLLLSDSTTERNCCARGDDERGVGARGHLCRNAADTTRQRAGNQCGVEKYQE
jgi:hypothetical protein